MAITCRSFRHLHDAYLDRELSESQMAEVHAHLLQCPECQRQVEIVRACGDVIALDDRTPQLGANFADRVLASLPARKTAATTKRSAWPRVKRWLEYGVVPAMAAALTFAVIIGPPARVAGVTAGDSKSMVLGTSATIDAIAGPVDGVVTLSGQLDRVATGAKNFCERSLTEAPKSLTAANAKDPAFVDQLLQPFFDLFNPPMPERSATDDVERF